MKKIILLAVICLLASASQVSAQFIIHNNGNAEVGVDNIDYENPGIPPQFAL